LRAVLAEFAKWLCERPWEQDALAWCSNSSQKAHFWRSSLAGLACSLLPPEFAH
jgi:hypothetical protein